ncbi:hypothetical protein GII33_22345 [Gordonia pseudamarae]|jgi:hypothetical protein|uniref:Uncharacterized protein n=1 Tax=Gordonia pseudamarae TaxID=2831662 RepID=A0ABX6IMV9_9ACTN|nr:MULTISPECIES: hypothetical protein [Gordonia]MBD0024284.1 hypothetical protein [Gordonia sp. (in: high G+C Gram-positive bacteria)]QHN28305.1 hypothetical protein GII33_22345 [Gordonia pseudamarae]QHN37174.1 hypothetical protein GII31_22005 [Gordonia pseudamarae]
MATHATTRHPQPRRTRPARAASGVYETASPHAPRTVDLPVVIDSIGNRCRVTGLTIIALLAVVVALALL